MEIRQLKYFVSVAETFSFSEASRQCFLSQSAISQQVKLLEEELGSQLFLRNTHSVSLTEAGEELLPLARQALKSVETCQEHMASIRGLMGGQLNIGMTYAMEPFARHAAVLMLKRYPKLRLNMYYKNSAELRRMLFAHELDLAFTINTAEEGDAISSKPIAEYHICAVMNKNHPLAKKEVLEFNDLLGHGFILPEKNSNAIRTLSRYLKNDLGLLNVRAYSDSPNAILNILQDTQFVSLLSANSVTSRRSLVAKDIKELTTHVQCYVHWLRDVCQKQSSKVFLEILTKESIPYLTALQAN